MPKSLVDVGLEIARPALAATLVLSLLTLGLGALYTRADPGPTLPSAMV